MSFIPEPRAHKNTPLTLTERYEIKKWIKRKYTCSQISNILERGKNTVVSEVRRNGGKEEYDPIKAHKNALERKIERDKKCRETLKKEPSNPYKSMSDRISNLEMQLEILFEEVKRLRNESFKH